jgi:hypothetical protein
VQQQKGVADAVIEAQSLSTKFSRLSHPTRLSLLVSALFACTIIITMCTPAPNPSAAPPASGKTYYVAKTGRNSNSCKQAKNPATAKQTIKEGINCLSAGDTLIVKSGTYSEGIKGEDIPSGSSGTPTVVKSEVKHGAILQTNSGRGISLGDGVNQHWIVLDGFVIDGSNNPNGQLNMNAKDGSGDIVIQNLEIKNIPYPDDTANGYSGASLSNKTSNTVLRNLLVHDIGRGSENNQHYWAYGIYFSGSGYTLENSEFYNITGFALHGYNGGGDGASNNIIRNNYFHDTGASLLMCQENNQIYNNILVRVSRGPGSGGIETGASCAGGASGNNQIHHNTIVDSGGNCINSGYSRGNTVRDNICWRNNNDTVTGDNGAGTVQDHNYLGQDPQFVNAGARDFHIQSGSPAKTAGSNGGEVGAYGNGNTCVGPECG